MAGENITNPVLDLFLFQITIFKFIDEKDVFMEFYSKLFGNRLVKEISASEDNEETMIKKLKVSLLNLGKLYKFKIGRMRPRIYFPTPKDVQRRRCQ